MRTRLLAATSAVLIGACGADSDARPSLPAPEAPLPRTAAALAADLTDTTRRLRVEISRWTREGDPRRGGPPSPVTLLALRQQRLYRFITDSRARAIAVVRRLPPDVRGEARNTIGARLALLAIPRTPGARQPRIRVGPAQPAGVLHGHYLEAQRRFGVHWSTLAAINFVESVFGRLRNASSAGARGPMQFIPSTWAAYGMGGDINDPRDAILGAANYLRASGAPRQLRRALFAYNHSTAYVRAILRYSERMRADPRTFYAYYSWQVYVAGPNGPRRVTGPR